MTNPRVKMGDVVTMEWCDDLAVPVVKEWDMNGVLISERPYTPEELAERVVRLAEDRDLANTRTIEEKLNLVMTQLQDGINILQTALDTPNSSITISPAWMKQTVLRPLRDAMQAQRLLIRLATHNLTGSD